MIYVLSVIDVDCGVSKKSVGGCSGIRGADAVKVEGCSYVDATLLRHNHPPTFRSESGVVADDKIVAC